MGYVRFCANQNGVRAPLRQSKWLYVLLCANQNSHMRRIHACTIVECGNDLVEQTLQPIDTRDGHVQHPWGELGGE